MHTTRKVSSPNALLSSELSSQRGKVNATGVKDFNSTAADLDMENMSLDGVIQKVMEFYENKLSVLLKF